MADDAGGFDRFVYKKITIEASKVELEALEACIDIADPYDTEPPIEIMRARHLLSTIMYEWSQNHN